MEAGQRVKRRPNRGRCRIRFVRRIDVLILALASAGAGGQSPVQKLTVTGKLVRVMAIGAESTGWAIEMGSAITIDNKQVNSIQVRYHSASKLEKLTNKQVRPPVSSSAGKESKRVSSPFSTFPP